MANNKVLKRTLETTSTHVETDRSGKVVELIGDVSIAYDAYVTLDEIELPIDASIEFIKREALKERRQTHLGWNPNYASDLESMIDYYKEHKIFPFDKETTDSTNK